MPITKKKLRASAQSSKDSKKKSSSRNSVADQVIIEDGIEKMSMGSGVTPQFIRMLARDVINYALDSSVNRYTFRAFYNEKKIHKNQFREYRKKYPELEDAFVEAKDIIGDRREHASMGVLTKPNSDEEIHLDIPNQIYATLDKYDIEWEEYRNKEAQRKNPDDNKALGTLKILSQHFAPKADDESRDNDKA